MTLFGGALAGGLVVAGFQAQMNVAGVALWGTAGNLVGALVSYGVERVGRRPLLARYGRCLLIRPRELERAEAFFARRGQVAVLVGRVLCDALAGHWRGVSNAFIPTSIVILVLAVAWISWWVVRRLRSTQNPAIAER